MNATTVEPAIAKPAAIPSITRAASGAQIAAVHAEVARIGVSGTP